jgi:hypothetical protein
MNQPVPNFSRADVERVVIREFGAASANGIWKILELYGREAWQTETTRVWMAALRSSDRDVGRLKKIIAEACQDFRDVLVAAEYPHYASLDFKTLNALSPSERAALYARDWNQYTAWVEKP